MSSPETLGGIASPGLPDPLTIARLAAEVFSAALPSVPSAGGVPVPANAHPAGFTLPPGSSGPSTPSAVPFGALPPGVNVIPTSPQSAANLGASAPARLPHAQAPNGVPDNMLAAAPAYDGRVGSQVLGVPQAPAANAPGGIGLPGAAGASLPGAAGASLPGAGGASLPGAPVLAPSSAPGPQSLPVAPAVPDVPASPRVSAAAQPYYFLDESRGAPSSRDVTAPGADALVARSFGLPGEDELRALLSGHGRAPTTPARGVPAPSAGSAAGHGGLPSATPGFYFLDATPAGQRHAASVPQVPAGARPPFDVNAIRRDFPILQERVNGRQLVWFDNAATTQKPQAVIDRLAHFYAHENSNIHRAAHELAARATDAYEDARETVRRFIGAGSVEEIIFVRGTTEAINLIAKSWGAKNIGAGDEIIVSNLEHHANIVPWQQLCQATGAKLRVIPVDDDGQVLLDEYAKLLNDRTKLVSVTQVSNALGTVVPVHKIVEMAHRAGAKALVDGAQSVSHMRVDVRALDADFFVFSGHKIFGPTGIGAVYGKRDILEDMPPWQGGGNMIQDVTFEKTVYHGPPARFEAGTGNIADAVGLGAALEYVERIGIENIGAYEHALLDYATAQMAPIKGVRLVGTAKEKASVLSFVLAGYTTEEVGKALNAEGIAVRTGHHCAQPILRRFGLETTVRPSLAFYNTCEEVDRMVAVVQRLAGSRR
ncbi:family 2A encapsulin nanocompartment cargo protein cysteine desulfurase [Derxia gummosa]|uniref:cysteine desulfurase n=1 Tax=Derxia gummosa DSM 723 TaxID=1121388 RepID=A0A8B6X7P3_9BURK|nr:family 2A encapsulin nanocompartment cargo protein cysteine desulfurase [Derxia gummosa]